MKTYKFHVTEYGLIGKTERFVEVKAKTKNSAANKIIDIKGNRDWVTKLVEVK